MNCFYYFWFPPKSAASYLFEVDLLNHNVKTTVETMDGDEPVVSALYQTH